MSKRFLLGFIVGLALVVGGGVGASRLKQETKEHAQFQAELEGATLLEGTVLSETQRIHSKLFNGFRQNDELISDLIAPHKGKKIVYGISVSFRMAEEPGNARTPGSYFGELARQSDAIVRGKVADKVSQITDDGKFIFTDYSVLVKEILKNNANAPLGLGTTITVTTPGGKVLIDDVIVKVTSNRFGPLPVNNQVVLFLTFLAETGDYKITQYIGSFELDGKSVHPIAGELPSGFLKNQDSFLTTVRALSKN